MLTTTEYCNTITICGSLFYFVNCVAQLNNQFKVDTNTSTHIVQIITV